MSSERDWTDLPPEVIHLISQKLPDLRYFIRCRAVCKRWFSSILLSDPPQQQLPWLIEYDEQYPKSSPLRKEMRFYSFVNSETCSIPIQESHRGKLYHRPGHSYLLVLDGATISLFNPLTNEEITLPQLPSRPYLIMPVFRGADPSRNWQLDITLLYDERCWRYVTIHPDKMRWQFVDNICFRTCYCDGMLFSTARDCTMVFDAASGKQLYTIPPPNDDPFTYCYLVESCGEILRVYLEHKYERSQIIVPSFNFHLYKLNFEGGKEQP
ncbi:F-box protein [Carex littledalei]|uniref:F-box protein n=1 Tax=Carex littledalei TaxID=544730 RepID=A0A833VQQ4_9POAL|nr:F-box protein [Carex littledalei]